MSGSASGRVSRVHSGPRETEAPSVLESAGRLKAFADDLDRAGRIKESAPVFIWGLRAIARCLEQEGTGAVDDGGRAPLIRHIIELERWFKENPVGVITANNDNNPLQLHPEEIRLLDASAEVLSSILSPDDRQGLSQFTWVAVSYLQRVMKNSKDYFTELTKMTTSANSTAYAAAKSSAGSLRETIMSDLRNGKEQMVNQTKSTSTTAPAPTPVARRSHSRSTFSKAFRPASAAPVEVAEADPEVPPAIAPEVTSTRPPQPKAEPTPSMPTREQVPSVATETEERGVPDHKTPTRTKPKVHRKSVAKNKPKPVRALQRKEMPQEAPKTGHGRKARVSDDTILGLLKKKMSQTEIARVTGYSQPGISHRIKVLREQGKMSEELKEIMNSVRKHPPVTGRVHKEAKNVRERAEHAKARAPTKAKHERQAQTMPQLSRITVDVLIGFMQGKTGVELSKAPGLSVTLVDRHTRVLKELGLIERETLKEYYERMQAERIPSTQWAERLLKLGGHAHWRINEDKLAQLDLVQTLKIQAKLELQRIADLRLEENQLEASVAELREQERKAKEGVAEMKQQLRGLLRDVSRHS